MILDDYCKQLTLTSNHPTTSNESSNLMVEVWATPSHRFELDYTTVPIKGIREQRAMFAYLESLRQGINTFTWVLPVYGEPSGDANNNPSVAETGAGSMSVIIDGSINSDEFLLPGDMIKFSNHNKCYTVTQPVSLSSQVIHLNAPLQVDLTSTETVITRNVAMTLKVDPTFEGQSISRTGGDLFTSYTARFIEDIR